MPIYAMRCNSCGSEQDIYRSVAKMDEDKPECCGVEMARRICKPYVMADIAPYRSQIDGSMITSRSQHKAHLRDHKMIEIGNEKPVERKQVDTTKDLKKDLYEVATGLAL